MNYLDNYDKLHRCYACGKEVTYDQLKGKGECWDCHDDGYDPTPF